MIRIKNVLNLHGKREDLQIPSHEEIEVDGSSWTALPALVDPHVHFRAPGDAHKEDWKTASIAAVYGGVTTVCDMPNNRPSCTTIERLVEKKQLIDAQLRAVGIPLHYGLYLGADAAHLAEISKAKGLACGIKVFMGGSTGDLLLDQQKDLEEVFKRASDIDMLVAVHAEDEEMLQQRKKEFGSHTDVSMHSTIRNVELACKAVERAINCALKYNTRLYLLHLSTKEEMDLVRKGKKAGAKIFAETTPHHLFLSTDDYATLGTLIQMNPPIRDKKNHPFLWEAISDGTIDTIGTDHAPHTLEEKKQPYGKAPSGIPGIDTVLPLLLNASSENKLSLKRLVELTRLNALKMFDFQDNNDLVLVDLSMEKTVTKEDLKTKCGWSPYLGRKLKGWPVATVIDGKWINHKRVQEKQREQKSVSEDGDSRSAKSSEPMRRYVANH